MERWSLYRGNRSIQQSQQTLAVQVPYNQSSLISTFRFVAVALALKTSNKHSLFRFHSSPKHSLFQVPL